MRAITRWLFLILSLAFLFTASAAAQLVTGPRAATEIWQCFGTCMPGCQRSAGLVTRNTSIADVLAPNECENFCKQACNPLPERRFELDELREFRAIIPEEEIDRFSIISDGELFGEITCKTVYWCQCSGAATCNDFIARCAEKGNTPICTDYDSEGRPIGCECFKGY